MRRHASTVLLVLLAVGVGVYALVIDRGTVGDDERAARPRNLLPAFRRDEVRRIVITSGATRVVLERDPSADAAARPWRMASPHVEPAETGAVQALLTALELASFVRRVEGTEMAGDAPRATGEIEMGQLIFRFALGPRAPVPEGAAYLRVEGEGTFVVTRDLVAELTRGADAYRERGLVPIAIGNVARVELPGAAMERMDGLSFRLAGGGARVARTASERVLAGLAELSAETFLDGLAPPAGARVVRVASRSGERFEVHLGGACPGDAGAGVVAVRVAPSPRAACVPSAAEEALALPEEMLDRRLFAAHSDEIDTLRVIAPGGARLDVARAGSGFRLREPESRELGPEEADAAGALISAIADASGTLATALASPGSGAAVTRVIVTRAGDGVDEEVRVEPGALPRAVRAADGVTLALSPDTARLLHPTLAALRPRRILPDTLRRAPIVAVATTCGPVPQEVRRQRDTWSLVTPRGLPGDGAAALELADAVLSARAVQRLEPAPFSVGCEVTLTFEGGAAPVRMAFGRDALARVGDDLFVPPPELRPLAERFLVGRQVFHVDPKTVAGAVLELGGKITKLDATAVGLAALNGLRAEEATSLGPPRADFVPRAILRLTLHAADSASTATRTFTFGPATALRGRRVVLARTSAVDATYALPEDRLAPLLGSDLR